MKHTKYIIAALSIVFIALSLLSSPEYASAEINIDNMRATIMQKREDIKNTLQHRLQQKREQTREKIQKRREEFKKRLAEIRNEHKRKIVQRINNRLAEINKRITNRFLHILDKLSSILGKIEQRTQARNEQGYDTSAVEQAIQDAKNAILSSREAVAVQAERDYTIEIESETTLKNNVGASIKKLKSDLKETRTTVQAAHKAVQNAAITLGALLNSQTK